MMLFSCKTGPNLTSFEDVGQYSRSGAAMVLSPTRTVLASFFSDQTGDDGWKRQRRFGPEGKLERCELIRFETSVLEVNKNRRKGCNY